MCMYLLQIFLLYFTIIPSCRIGEGSGSLVEVMQFMPKPLLLTCNHVIPTKEIAQQSTISFDRLSTSKPGVEVKGSELFDCKLLFVTHKVCIQVQ